MSLKNSIFEMRPHTPKNTMDIENLTRQIEHGSIEKFVLSKTPESDVFWFVYALHRETQQFKIVKEDQELALAFGCIDDAIHLLAEAGFDGKVDVLWDMEEQTCN
jgi:hypothetical protein